MFHAELAGHPALYPARRAGAHPPELSTAFVAARACLCRVFCRPGSIDSARILTSLLHCMYNGARIQHSLPPHARRCGFGRYLVSRHIVLAWNMESSERARDAAAWRARRCARPSPPVPHSTEAGPCAMHRAARRAQPPCATLFPSATSPSAPPLLSGPPTLTDIHQIFTSG